MSQQTELTPCPQILPALERIAQGKEKGGVFMWYVRKHISMCDHCKETLDALVCYQEALEKAMKETEAEGDVGVTRQELSDLLKRLS
jgi:hypothetical protein